MRMRRCLLAIVAVTLGGLATCWAVQAHDWTADHVMGGVFALEDGQWIRLTRGSKIADNQIVKTALSGSMTLSHASETIRLGAGTTVQIRDVAGFTTVFNHQGTVA